VNKLKSRVVAAALMSMLAAVSAGNAMAEDDPQDDLQDEPERGRVIGYTCLGCHGIEGYRNAYPSYRVPKLGGQKPAALQTALQAYRGGSRRHHTMQAQGASLTQQDVEDVVAWIALSPRASDDLDEHSVGGLEPARACVACHGTAGKDVIPAPPVLSGQHRSYLAEALKQYKDGERGNTVMTGFTAGLTERDIEQLAAFFAARQGLHTLGDAR
jgi:cytochrome c553